MKEVLKRHKQVFNKGNANFNKKQRHIYLQESIDIFAKNLVKDLPFMSRYVTTTYNKYLLNKYRDKLCRINNFLASKTTKSDDLSQAFEKLNFIRIKIMLLERDINAYRNALRNSFDAKDTNIILQKRIHQKYAKLRKFDTYQNLNLAIIYDQSILGKKIKMYEEIASKNAERINNKFDSPENLQRMQKEFIYNLIIDRQQKDQIFKNDVNIEDLQYALKFNPKFNIGLSRIETFANEYLSLNPGSLSKSFTKFKSEHKKSTINTIVKDYLELYKSQHPSTNVESLNKIQQDLLASFTYQDFKNSEIFNSIDTAISANNTLLRAKINFAKLEMIQELRYCLDLPEINNYFKIIENKDKIKNYVVSTERLFVRKIEEEFPEITSTSFIYLYNKVRKLLETYIIDIISTEQYFVSDFISAVIYNEFPNPNNKEDVEEILENISIGIYRSPISIEAKNNFDLFNKLQVQFSYIKRLKSIDFDKKIDGCKLFHGVLVDGDNQPILPLDIQSKIINMPLEAQINLATNYHSSSVLELLDEFSISDTGELKLGKQILEFGINSSKSIQRLSLTQQSISLENYIKYNDDEYYLEDEINLAKYILAGIDNCYKNSVYETITDKTISEGNLFKILSPNPSSQKFEKPDIPDIENEEDIEDNDENVNQLDLEEDNKQKEENKKEITEVENFKKAKQYIAIILKESDSTIQSKMLLRIQKRINSKDLYLTDVQIANLNEELTPLQISLRSPKAYVDHLVEKYKSAKRDINSLQVGLKLRIRMGYLVLTDEEIETINQDYNFELIQRSTLRTNREKHKLKDRYIVNKKVDESTKEKLSNIEALVRAKLKKRSSKITQLDMRLYKILQNNN